MKKHYSTDEAVKIMITGYVIHIKRVIRLTSKIYLNPLMVILCFIVVACRPLCKILKLICLNRYSRIIKLWLHEILVTENLYHHEYILCEYIFSVSGDQRFFFRLLVLKGVKKKLKSK